MRINMFKVMDGKIFIYLRKQEDKEDEIVICGSQ